MVKMCSDCRSIFEDPYNYGLTLSLEADLPNDVGQLKW